MKNYFLTITLSLFAHFALFAQMTQSADPGISIIMSPPAISLHAIGTLSAIVGNYGNDSILVNTLSIVITVNSNVEILGLDAGANNDSRWSIASLTTGAGNTVTLHNTGGDFAAFDVGELFLEIKGMAISSALLIVGNIAYQPGNNPALGGAPNSSQGDASVTNDEAQTSVIVNSSTEDCANGVDDDLDGFIDCTDGNCNISGTNGSNSVSISPTTVNLCQGDSIMLIPHIANPATPSPTVSYQWSGGESSLGSINMKVKTAGVYSVTVTSLTGCSATDDQTVFVITVNNAVSQNGAVLAAQLQGATYQWVNCSNGNSPIAGANAQTYTATQNGSYAVIVSQNGCSRISDCLTVVGLGFEEIQNGQNEISVYPNPFSNDLIISFQNSPENAEVNIYSIDGKQVYRNNNLSSKQNTIPLSFLGGGQYIVQVIERKNVTVVKVFKK